MTTDLEQERCESIQSSGTSSCACCSKTPEDLQDMVPELKTFSSIVPELNMLSFPPKTMDADFRCRFRRHSSGSVVAARQFRDEYFIPRNTGSRHSSDTVPKLKARSFSVRMSRYGARAQRPRSFMPNTEVCLLLLFANSNINLLSQNDGNTSRRRSSAPPDTVPKLKARSFSLRMSRHGARAQSALFLAPSHISRNAAARAHLYRGGSMLPQKVELIFQDAIP